MALPDDTGRSGSPRYFVTPDVRGQDEVLDRDTFWNVGKAIRAAVTFSTVGSALLELTIWTNGLGKTHAIAKITGFFAGLNILFPAANAHFITGLKFFGGFFC